MSAEELEQTSFSALDDNEEKVENTLVPEEPVITATPSAPTILEDKPPVVTVITPTPISTVTSSPTTTTTTTPTESKTPITTPKAATTTSDSGKRSSKGKPLPFSVDPTDQVPVEQLSLVDVIMWRNIFVTIPIFLAIQALFLLLCKYEFTVVNLIGKMVFIQVGLSFVYMVVLKIIQNNSNHTFPFQNVEISQELVNKIVSGIVANVNAGLKYYLDILSCKNLLKTLAFGVGVLIVSWLGKKMSGEIFMFLALNIIFTLPLIYEWKQDEIDHVVKIGCEQSKKYIDLGISKLPPQAKDILAKLNLEDKKNQ